MSAPMPLRTYICRRPLPAIFLLLTMPAALSFAQGSSRASIANNPSGPFTDSLERRARETALRSLRVEPRGTQPGKKIPPAVFERLNDDFKRIQVIRLAMVQNIQDSIPFEYHRLAKDTFEIRKRALRIKEFWADTPEPVTDDLSIKQVELDEATIQDAVWKLCLEISRFTGNPIFESSGSYRARDAAEAIQTLDLIVNLSTNIRNSAQVLT